MSTSQSTDLDMGIVVRKPAQMVSPEVRIELREGVGDYVGRGAFKLLAAIDHFELSIRGARAIDVGSSTGGFTQVLLERNAERVVALDVGRDQLHPRLRADSRVLVCEGTNVRDADGVALGGPFDVVTADLSFISLAAVAADLEQLGGDSADWIVLVKPQFEVGADALSKSGVVLSAADRGRAMVDVVAAFSAVGLTTVGAMPSPIVGGSGNREGLLWLRREGMPILSADAFKVLADE